MEVSERKKTQNLTLKKERKLIFVFYRERKRKVRKVTGRTGKCRMNLAVIMGWVFGNLGLGAS